MFTKKFPKWLTYTLAIVLQISSLLTVAYFSHEKGVKDGIDTYHDACYNVGGIIIRGRDGAIVGCQPLGQMGREEQKQLDKNDRI
jgi:hypothetical protein